VFPRSAGSPRYPYPSPIFHALPEGGSIGHRDVSRGGYSCPSPHPDLTWCRSAARAPDTMPATPVLLAHREGPGSVSVSVPDRTTPPETSRGEETETDTETGPAVGQRAATRDGSSDGKKRKGEGPKARKASLGWNSRQDGGRLVERSGNPSPMVSPLKVG